jgi:hypothetical protein
MMNTNDNNDYQVHVNSESAALLTRSDGVNVVNVPW